MNLLAKNLGILGDRSPELTRDIVERHEPREDLEILNTPSGEPTARLKGQFLHSSREPRREAAKLFPRDKELPDILILQGFALGYHAEEFLKAYSQGEIWIIEPDIPLFLAVCSHRDLTNLLGNPRVTLLLAPQASTLGNLAASLPERRFSILKVRSVYEKDREYYGKTDRAIGDVLEQRKINRDTLKRFGPLWVRNLLHNLPLMARALGVQRLKDILRDIPVLIIAAGPSMDALLPFLGALRKRMALIAVDTTLQVLGKAGIAPDFLAVVDPQFYNSRYLDGLYCPESFLVAESSTHPRVFRIEPRGIFFGESSFPLGQSLEKGTDIGGRLGAGGSVATFAWEIARFAGAREIYCSGLDLGFPDLLTHQKDCFFEREALYTTHRLSPMEGKGFRSLKSGVSLWVENNSGGKTLSDPRMLVYARWFENRIVSTSIPTYSLSAQGAAVKGMPLRRMADLLNLPPRRIEIEDRLRRLDRASSSPKPQFYQGLRELEEDLTSMKERAKRGLSLLEGIEGLLEPGLDRGQALKNRLEQLNWLDRKILGNSSRNVAGFLFQNLIDELSRPEEAAEKDGFPSIRNSRRLYDEILSSCRYHLGLLKNALQRLGNS